ncbi:hypothetical protein [Rhodobium gokarnense]|uniref:Uncharacterized protein n=1 Tax=Rhodobium gokarnense TaxID=364296 RepID=A0ABT3HD98_9HYPH|nr:hypothetical protein [Rhodobium gokarnense]MCW2308387.1 hypothetical protein [Rhodobium gokarnense]
MTTILTRLYEKKKDAESVCSALEESGFSNNDMDIVGPPRSSKKDAEEVSTKDDTRRARTDARRALVKAGLWDEAADAYAGPLSEGNYLLIVRVPTGRVLEARAAADAVKSIPVKIADPESFTFTREVSRLLGKRRYSPMMPPSDMLIFTNEGMPAVLKTQHPFSSWLNLPLLSKPNPRAKLWEPKSSAPVSAAIGMAPLSDRKPKVKLLEYQTPLSTFMNFPLLTKRKTMIQ